MEVRSSHGLGYDVVLNLMKDFLLQGYALYIDNFYMCPVFACDLYHKGIHVTGTGVPSQVRDLKKKIQHKSVSRGEGVYVRKGVCAYAIWKDTKRVTVLSTEHPGHCNDTVRRNVKDKEGKYEKQEVPIPIMVYNYNCFINGVDLSEHLIS